MSRRAWAYIGAVLLLGAALAGAALAGLPGALVQWPTFTVLVALATLAQLCKAEAPNHVLFYATPVFFFAGLLLLPPPLVVPLVVVPHLVEWARERWRRSPHLRAWYLQPFNVALYLLAADAAHLVYTTLERAQLPVLAQPLPPVVVVTAAALAYVAVNHAILGQVLVLARGASWRETGVLDPQTNRTALILLFVGYVVAVLWQLNHWLILPALAPLVLIYDALTIPQLKHEAHVDGKTGVNNARRFQALYEAECERARRFNRPLAVIMADLDHFKRVNDTHGHLAGDAVLAAAARIIRDTVRELDVVGRFGGEEFAVVLPEAGLLEAQMLAERIRQAVEAAEVAVAASPTPLRVTLSLGVACYPADATTPTDLTHAADVAMYQAKARGRNRVVCAADVPRSLLQGAAGAPALPAPPLAAQAAPAVEPMASAEPVDAVPRVPVDQPAPPILNDPLTGLGAHRAFHEALRRAVTQAATRGEAVTLARLDLDRFKALNEQHGHGHGDAVLGALAALLGRGRSEDRAFRLGGDEFALLLPGAGLPEAAAALERLRVTAARDLAGATVSVGVADLAAVADAASAGEGLLDGAEAALAVAKRRGGNAVVTVDEVQDGAALTASARARALRRLLTDGQIAVAFQPIWDLERGHILAFEALARPAASYGFAGPQEAFDAAERAGQAHDLDALCRRAILARAAALPPDALLFLNVSPQTLDHDLLAGTTLVEAVEAAGLTPGRVVLEITERSVARPGVVVREAARLRALGFRLALDDAGAGNAGLEMLSQVAVDFVKIDRGVVAQSCTATAARAVLAGILAIARETGAYVIAEGIETAEMLAFVQQAGAGATECGGIQGVQGYLLGHPSETLPDGADAERPRALIDAA